VSASAAGNRILVEEQVIERPAPPPVRHRRFPRHEQPRPDSRPADSTARPPSRSPTAEAASGSRLSSSSAMSSWHAVCVSTAHRRLGPGRSQASSAARRAAHRAALRSEDCLSLRTPRAP